MMSKLGNWYVRRAAEISVFGVALLVRSLPDANIATLPFMAAALAVYGLALLYFPVSALTWLLASRWNPAVKLLTDSLAFFVHGWIAMSVMHNGPWLIARPLDLQNPANVGWVAVGALHLLLVLLSIYGGQQRSGMTVR